MIPDRDERVVFEVRRIVPPLCSYPTCGDGRPRRAGYLIRKHGTDNEWAPVCQKCKAYVRAVIGATERRYEGTDDGYRTDSDRGTDPAVSGARRGDVPEAG